MRKLLFLLLLLFPISAWGAVPKDMQLFPNHEPYINGAGVVSGDIDLNGNLLYDTTGDLCIHDSACGATGHDLATGDLIIDGQVEFNSTTYFDVAGYIYAAMTITANNKYKDTYGPTFGNSNDNQISYVTAQTPDAWYFGVGADSRALIIAEKADQAYDFAHVLQTNPTLYVQSANQSADEWISLTHDQTNGVIDVGTGSIKFLDVIEPNVGMFLADYDYIIFGTSSDAGIFWRPDQTNDALMFYTDSGSANASGTFLFTENSSKAIDHAFPIRDEPTISLATTKAAGLHIVNQTESLTFAGNPGDATKTTATLIPDGALLLGVSTRVTIAGTNCSAYYVGTAGNPDHFADDATTGVSQGTDTDNTDATTNYYTLYYPATADTAIVITGTDGADGATNCFDMVVEVTTSYIDISAATQN